MTAAVASTRPALPPGITAGRIIAILRRIAPEAALPTAQALASGGVGAIEVTWDSPGAATTIARMRRELPTTVAVGAGTILDQAAADAAVAAGATFLLSPHLDVAVVERMAARGVPMLPGVVTPNEVLAAWRAGAAAVKLFPAESLGPGYLNALRAPLPHIAVVPTGGVDVRNAGPWINAGAVALGVGGKLVDAALIAAGGWDELRRRAVALVAAAGGHA